MMNAILFLTAMLLPSYSVEDFHYYNSNLQSRGLPIVNKIYVEAPKDKKEFFEFIDKIKGIERFKDFRTPELNGVLLFLNNKRDTIETLNRLAEKKYRAFPVVIFDGIECTTSGEIVVAVQPSVNIINFTQRLNKVAEGQFKVQELRPKLYAVTIEELSNPSNILILANLLAKDNFWTKYAMVGWIPINGYVKANVSVETPAISHLGEIRNFKVTVDVFNPEIKVRTDLLPQLGQSLLPFPFAGEVWFDPTPPEITEVKTSSGKTVIITFRFRQLQYGNFIFQPIIVSYEKDGELQTVKTNMCQYSIRSVIAGTDIDDIQPRTEDGLDLLILGPVGFPKTKNPNKALYWYVKMATGSLCFSIAAMLLGGALASLKRSYSTWLYSEDVEDKLWKDLKNCDADTQYAYYVLVSRRLNQLMIVVFGVSLYSVEFIHCTDNFKHLVYELDKIYQPNATLNPESLRDFVSSFCKDRKYR